MEKEPGCNCEHRTYSNSKQSRFWIDISSDCAKMLFLPFLNLRTPSLGTKSDPKQSEVELSCAFKDGCFFVT